MHRRTFLQATLATCAGASAQPSQRWGGPVLDAHLHLRPNVESNWTHMQGCGVTHAVLLTRAADEGRAKQAIQQTPGRYARSVAADPALPDSPRIIRESLQGGAVSIGELKHHLALDSPEMRRVYDIAAEMQVPVLVHIQVFPHFPGELPYNTGYPQFDKVLKAHPKTIFLGHADLFWANISADVPTDRGYPTGPIKPGGLTDRWLSDYPNLYADISANSGNNALSRDSGFSRGFLARHKSKLIFGSDCSCADGKGAGISQGNNPEAARLAGKCVAASTLELIKGLTTPEIFRQITWENGTKLLKLRF